MSDSLVTMTVERVRQQYLETLSDAMGAQEASWVQVSLNLDYLSEYRADCDTSAEISVTTVGRTSFTLSYRLYQGELPCVTGSCVLVNIDHSSGRPLPFTEMQRQALGREVLNFYRIPR